jgi:hypothetical protein
MSTKIKFSELPESSKIDIKEGIYILEVNDIIEAEMGEGGVKYTMTHDIVGMSTKVSYDNYGLIKEDGSRHAFGLSKLRALITATEIEVEDIDLPLIRMLLKGKRFKAKLALNEKGFPQIVFKDIYSVKNPIQAINEDVLDAKQSEKDAKNYVGTILKTDI